MAASLFLALSRRLQAPIAALLLLGALQLTVAAKNPGPTTHVHQALATALR